MSTFDPGLSLVICRVASSPLSEGIPMSMTTTSGRRRWAICTAWRPLSASPTTSMSSSASSKARRPCRTTVWSSASITVIFCILQFSCFVGGDYVRRLEIPQLQCRLRLPTAQVSSCGVGRRSVAGFAFMHLFRGPLAVSDVARDDLHGWPVFKRQRRGGHFHIHHLIVQSHEFFLNERNHGRISLQPLHPALSRLPEKRGAFLAQLAQTLLHHLPVIRADDFLQRLADELFNAARPEQPGSGGVGEDDAIITLDQERVRTHLHQLPVAFLALLERLLCLSATRPLLHQLQSSLHSGGQVGQPAFEDEIGGA